MHRRRLAAVALALALAGLGAFVARADTASASHAWGGYHWARTANPFTVKLGDNLSGAWKPILSTTSSDWSQSTVLDTTIVAGQATGRCRATLGRVEVCNATYGRNGWLGVAQIWLSDGHIAQGTVKLNDTYFNTPTYNTSAWRNLVSCQEVGHTFGLDHQDENFDNANLGTCMDYTRDPDGGGAYGPGNEHPNQGDYDELLCIYDPAYSGKTLSTTTHSCKGTGHLDSTTSVGAAAGPGASGLAGKPFGAEGPNIPADFGTPAGPRDSYGRPILFERDLGAGQRLFTWVFWALP